MAKVRLEIPKTSYEGTRQAMEGIREAVEIVSEAMDECPVPSGRRVAIRSTQVDRLIAFHNYLGVVLSDLEYSTVWHKPIPRSALRRLRREIRRLERLRSDLPYEMQPAIYLAWNRLMAARFALEQERS